jgi:hypothetical protein
VIVDFLCANIDIFAWSPSDMPGIPREVTEHALEIRAKLVKQRLRRFDEEKRKVIGEGSTSYWRPNSSRGFIIPSGWLILY